MLDRTQSFLGGEEILAIKAERRINRVDVICRVYYKEVIVQIVAQYYATIAQSPVPNRSEEAPNNVRTHILRMMFSLWTH